MKTIEIVEQAKEQLVQLTRLQPDYLSSFTKQEDGWRVTVEFVEMRRVPDSNDILATYEARLDSEGNLLSYRRLKRYRRDQIMEEDL
jgi:hypothetical protein